MNANVKNQYGHMNVRMKGQYECLGGNKYGDVKNVVLPHYACNLCVTGFSAAQQGTYYEPLTIDLTF